MKGKIVKPIKKKIPPIKKFRLPPSQKVLEQLERERIKEEKELEKERIKEEKERAKAEKMIKKGPPGGPPPDKPAENNDEKAPQD